jgi:hypothetical protein
LKGTPRARITVESDQKRAIALEQRNRVSRMEGLGLRQGKIVFRAVEEIVFRDCWKEQRELGEGGGPGLDRRDRDGRGSLTRAAGAGRARERNFAAAIRSARWSDPFGPHQHPRKQNCPNGFHQLKLLGGLLFGVVQFFQILIGIFVEILFAGFAAKLHFTAFMFENERLAHLAELLVRNDAGLERIGTLGFLIFLFIGGQCRG